ncbi:MAG TPA: copper chaperone PCu(A)C [Burkholderiales bacterium]|nr:copper chaperone PCu(A)C [Burkholderiales bacterium]
MIIMQKYYPRLRKARWLLVAGLLACGPARADGPVTVSGAWVRGTAGPQTSTGAFMSIRSSKDVDLVAAESPAAKSVSLHETIMADGVAKMRPVAKLKIPAGQTVELKPGAYHVMLEGLKKPLAKGASVPIVLTFEDPDKKRFRIRTKAQVRALGEGNPPAHEMMPGMNMK